MEKKLEGTAFELELVKGLLSFVPDHMKAVIADHSIDYNDFGTEKERKLKTILHFFFKYLFCIVRLEYYNNIS